MSLSTVKLDSFAISRKPDGASIAVQISGTADIAALEALGKFLGDLFEETRKIRPSEVTVDLRELEFMNSSCFKAFVVWLTRVSELDKANQYPIRFIGTTSRHWQKRSLAALSCFAADIVKVDM